MAGVSTYYDWSLSCIVCIIEPPYRDNITIVLKILTVRRVNVKLACMNDRFIFSVRLWLRDPA